MSKRARAAPQGNQVPPIVRPLHPAHAEYLSTHRPVPCAAHLHPHLHPDSMARTTSTKIEAVAKALACPVETKDAVHPLPQAPHAPPSRALGPPPHHPLRSTCAALHKQPLCAMHPAGAPHTSRRPRGCSWRRGCSGWRRRCSGCWRRGRCW
ncbi:hypothetical protein BC834DRAFT_625937 [Gloeopeniophorella convolvens]|nr:hypothetical protein BC834DRAFT_625937 [Gloeopeniophorella convolvens]